MTFQSVDPNRLFQVLNNTGLQNKDTPLFQLLFDMIGVLLKLSQITSSSSSGGGSGTTNITNIIQQILESGSGSGGDGDTILISGSNTVTNNTLQQLIDLGDGSGGDSDAITIPGPKGDDGPMVPYYIGVNETFLVPLYKQALFSMNIDNNGTIILDGFLIEVDDKVSEIYAQLSDTTNQEPGVTTPIKITFNTEDQLSGIAHSGGDITIESDGLYQIIVGGQVGETNNGKVIVDMWLKKNGSDVANSGVRNTITVAADNKVVILNYILPLVTDDVLNAYFSVDDASKGAGLKAFAPAGEAGIPSVMVTLFRLGDP